MLNSIGLQGPGLEGLLSSTLPAPRCHGTAGLGLGRGLLGRGLRLICERLEELPGVEALELNLSCPNVEEAPESSAQIVSACRTADDEARSTRSCPLRFRYRGVRPRGRRRGGGRPLARQHDPRDGARPCHAPADPCARDGGYSGPRAETRRPCVCLGMRPRGRCADRRARRRAAPVWMRSSSWQSAPGCLPWHRPVRRSDSTGADSARADGEAAARGFADPLDAWDRQLTQ